MSLLTRVRNAISGERLNRDLDEEMRSHIEEAIEGGRDPEEARRGFGSVLHAREESRDAKLVPWLESLAADAVFGWRQLLKNKAVSGAAILSLALAIGSCTAAFRLVDAMLLRPMPVADAERLFFLTYDLKDSEGKFDTGDSYEYPGFRLMREAVQGQADLMAISYAGSQDVTYGSDDEMEKAVRQFVSGSMFGVFGLKPALGRLLTVSDDLKPGEHPVTVLSYDYWTRRFGRDPKVLGKKLRQGQDLFEVVGVGPAGFTGTETGLVTDFFLPTMANARAINNASWGWFRTWVHLRPGSDLEQVRQKLQASLHNFRNEKAKGFGPGRTKSQIEEYTAAPAHLEPASAGVSGMQKSYRRALTILGAVVCLVLLIACANVANLMTAQAAMRARELALRVSIGAGRARLVQLVLMESLLVAIAATALGWLFAWWAAPFVVSMINPPQYPIRLILTTDWRVLSFGAALATGVTLLFGLLPALRASAIKPVSALKGGDNPHSRRRMMNALVAAQVAFCFLVHFVTGLFVASFERMSNQPTGFATERVLLLATTAKGDQSPAAWDEVEQRLREQAGLESVARASWGLMSGNGWSSAVWANGREPSQQASPYFLDVSPGWFAAMKIPLIDGRDFRREESQLQSAIVNEAFARYYFDGQNPVGKSIESERGKKRARVEIVGYVRDARYRNMKEAIRPTVYVPNRDLDGEGKLRPKDWATFVVRTKGDDVTALAPALRRAVKETRPDFRVSDVRSQAELVRNQTLRERLLALLSAFFAAVALILAAVGLYGVLNYAVLQRRREFGIRRALGAQAGDVARRVTGEVLAMLFIGSAAGLGAGVASEHYLEALLFQVKVTDVAMLTLPLLTIFAAALLAALPPVIRAVRIDPAAMLRAE
ncbi:MAG: ABC transporter permease [Acidobacteriota bacterium]